MNFSRKITLVFAALLAGQVVAQDAPKEQKQETPVVLGCMTYVEYVVNQSEKSVVDTNKVLAKTVKTAEDVQKIADEANKTARVIKADSVEGQDLVAKLKAKFADHVFLPENVAFYIIKADGIYALYKNGFEAKAFAFATSNKIVKVGALGLLGGAMYQFGGQIAEKASEFGTKVAEKMPEKAWDKTVETVSKVKNPYVLGGAAAVVATGYGLKRVYNYVRPTVAKNETPADKPADKTPDQKPVDKPVDKPADKKETVTVPTSGFLGRVDVEAFKKQVDAADIKTITELKENAKVKANADLVAYCDSRIVAINAENDRKEAELKAENDRKETAKKAVAQTIKQTAFNCKPVTVTADMSPEVKAAVEAYNIALANILPQHKSLITTIEKARKAKQFPNTLALVNAYENLCNKLGA